MLVNIEYYRYLCIAKTENGEIAQSVRASDS